MRRKTTWRREKTDSLGASMKNTRLATGASTQKHQGKSRPIDEEEQVPRASTPFRRVAHRSPLPILGFLPSPRGIQWSSRPTERQARAGAWGGGPFAQTLRLLRGAVDALAVWRPKRGGTCGRGRGSVQFCSVGKGDDKEERVPKSLVWFGHVDVLRSLLVANFVLLYLMPTKSVRLVFGHLNQAGWSSTGLLPPPIGRVFCECFDTLRTDHFSLHGRRHAVLNGWERMRKGPAQRRSRAIISQTIYGIYICLHCMYMPYVECLGMLKYLDTISENKLGKL